MSGHQFAAATQLLTAAGTSRDEAFAAADSMADATKVEMPATGSGQLTVVRGRFGFKEFRTPTKQLLCGLANSLQQGLPDGFSLMSARPKNLLLPRGPDGIRCEMSRLEMRAQGFDQDFPPRFFTYNSETHEARHDSYLEEEFYHLCVSADEGTEESKMQVRTQAPCKSHSVQHTCAISRDRACHLRASWPSSTWLGKGPGFPSSLTSSTKRPGRLQVPSETPTAGQTSCAR